MAEFSQNSTAPEPQMQWNGMFGDSCNLPIDCVDCNITECPGRANERGNWHMQEPLQDAKYCPICGCKLHQDGERLLCDRHGEMKVYVVYPKGAP